MKFDVIPPSSLGGDLFQKKLLTDDGHPMITKAHLEPMAQMRE